MVCPLGIPSLRAMSGITSGLRFSRIHLDRPRDVPGLRTGTSRGRSRWILENRRPLVIPDIARSEGIPKGQTIEAQGIRGYLGVPIFSSDGEVIGILRVLTYQPREFLR